MIRSILQMVVVLGILSVLPDSRVIAQATFESGTQSRIDSLIEQLGHPNFQTREAASRAILDFGMAAKPAVVSAYQDSPDPEIRRRCGRLLPRLDFHFCWGRASQILGNSQETKRQFADLYWTETELWYAFVEASPDLPTKYARRRSELSAGYPKNRFGAPITKIDVSRYELQEGRLATLLVIGAECRQQIPPDALRIATRLFQQRWGGQYAKDTPPLLRKSYVIWAEEILPLPIEYEGDKLLELARTTLQSSDLPAMKRQQALLQLARSRTKQDDELIRRYLTDATVCDTVFNKGVKSQVQLRDIALAASIYRAGKDPIAFGFANLKLDADLIFRPSSLGFPDDDARSKAFQAWNAVIGTTR
ncbi:hypothetical protein [Tuwongella immobilis]|uniref:Uncharacterized protein n=1 Tax=Tuwongella immobilis TaxID=692036 RepID=A0A6C2YKL4_9BACT|nr:hypothetical protein [Tuwongella immobilis]VIP01914.1 Uncharacterized protein OS=Pirellula staleyi (strain ATCC 27377 / DSM 6068 / ICPB 4128) GN=Psta_4070 PE=4 SV=1 [Tuwongella immobilis]VTR99830.1 Uncharacterized protein OS=Pirellula staleyi (strain ATCC 27377 / DSM 6068 / ICPB 4128) GN=Psta_4070 PE=4 SV=1 [Tuwongella immobilis]